MSDPGNPVAASRAPNAFPSNEQCSKSLCDSIVLVGFEGFPYWIIIVPNMLDSKNPLIIKQQGF